MNCIVDLKTPQLQKIHSGKVRESFKINEKTRMIVATDRISSFDEVLQTPIPGKGAVLNGLSAFWFSLTNNIIDNHFIASIDPNISLVREAIPIRIEMVVRGYLTGSMWRYYSQGKRVFSGIKVPEGLKKHDKFKELLITPTTKEQSDREINPKEIIAEEWADKDTYEQMEQVALELFQKAQEFLIKKNLILVDTKYEFGLIDKKLVLIDEVHTPDSSRFWLADDYEKAPENCIQMDKEFVRNYLLQNKKNGKFPKILPEDVVLETSKRYQRLLEMITDNALIMDDFDIKERINHNLVRHKLIKEGYIVIIMGSTGDLEHCNKIKKIIEQYDINVDMRVVSAHKNGEDIFKISDEYNSSIEPGAAIAVAGLSNGLGGALAANLTIPVYNCPPFKDQFDMFLNINSSLMMPSKIPVATIINPESAAMIALRSLNLHRIRKIFTNEINQVKKNLREDDRKVRGR